MFTENEKEYLRQLVQRDLEHFKAERKTILDVDVALLAGEEKYEEFLGKLIEKLR